MHNIISLIDLVQSVIIINVNCVDCIASLQLEVLHRYLCATRQWLNNHPICTGKLYVSDRYNCRNLFLTVQSGDELRKSPDKLFQILMAL